MNINFAQYIVRDSNGNLDVTATMSKFESDIVSYDASTRGDLETTAATIEAVFKKFNNANINMPALVSMVTAELKATPDTFALIAERVKNVVASSPKFSVQKGRNGGVKFIAAE